MNATTHGNAARFAWLALLAAFSAFVAATPFEALTRAGGPARAAPPLAAIGAEAGTPPVQLVDCAAKPPAIEIN
jgi:hypothetical protein